MIDSVDALLLDMNGTFMFEHDRLDREQDFSRPYRALGGRRDGARVQAQINAAVEYLAVRYPDPAFRYAFPSVRQALQATGDDDLCESELDLLVEVVALHELGVIPETYAAAIHRLAQRFIIGLVIDIWAPRQAWLGAFHQSGISSAVSAMSFSSCKGIVKPAPEPFLEVLRQLDVEPSRALVVGDSVRRDLGGATAAGIPCVLVGGSEHPDAVASFSNLLEFEQMHNGGAAKSHG